MNKTLFLFCFFFVARYLSAQTAYTFESTTIPTQWVAQTGALSINSLHYKEGLKSLCWKTTGQSVLTITPTSYSTSITNCIDFQLHSPVITKDTLKVDFYSGTSIVRSTQILINYTGWRDVCRAYAEFQSTNTVSISKIIITLCPIDQLTARTYYFDDVNLSLTTPKTRIYGTHWINDTTHLKNSSSMDNLKSFAYPIDISSTTPTATELSAINTLKANTSFILAPTVGTAAQLAAAIKFTDSLMIVRNSDGSVRGLPLNLKADNLTVETLSKLVRHLEVLAADGTASTTRFNNLLDHLLDQGLAEGVEYFQAPWDYDGSRAIPDPLLSILSYCTAAQKVEVLKLCKWILLYGDFYLPQDTYLYSLNSDRIHLFSNYFMIIALNQPTTALIVRELKAYKRWLDRNGEYSTGNVDFLKSDGTGFHHETPYVSYMVAYKEFAQDMYNLKGTPFKVEKATYENLKKAVISEYLMASVGPSNKEGYMGLSLCGRKPSQRKTTFTQSFFYNLVNAGTDLYGTQDNELAAAYNYFYQSNKYNVPVAANYLGFYAFNYGSFGVYRQANWVATMRSPSAITKGSEIFSSENRFGRYQSHGTLEVQYNGYDKSGYPKDSTNWGGWDWNVMPGATTVHYTNWSDLMPSNNTTQRFDQYAKTKNFSGALSWDDMGLFGCDFDQLDTWGGNQKFTPTNLVFKKSVLAVDGLLIDIGTNIKTSDTFAGTLNTATNLFQSIISANSMALQVNGASISTTYSTPLVANSANTLISPEGTGYILPKGNDAVNVIYGSQTTPVHSGVKTKYTNVDSTGTLIAAKAYIVHGKNPTNKSYQFVVVPSATAPTLATTAANVNAGLTYQLVNADSNMHVIYYKPRKIMSYTFFKPVTNVKDTAFHLVKGISTEALLLERKSTVSGTAYDFAIANPNLRPKIDINYGWIATPTISVLTLKGKWIISNGAPGVSIVPSSYLETKIQVELTDGQPQYFTVDIVPKHKVMTLEDELTAGKPYLIVENNTLKLNLGIKSSSAVEIIFVYPDASCSTMKKYFAIDGMVSISNPPLHPGLNLVNINLGGKNIVLKTIY